MAETVPVLETGEVLQDGVPKSLDNWFGLYEFSEQYLLLPVTVTVVPHFDELMDQEADREKREKWSGRTILARPSEKDMQLPGFGNEGQPLIMLQRPGLKSGKVKAAFPGNGSYENRHPGSFAPLESIDLYIEKGQKYSYVLERGYHPGECINLHHDTGVRDSSPEVQAVRRKEGHLPERYNWNLLDPLPELQPYCSRENGVYPTLVWAGDIDGDYMIDLIFDVAHDSTNSRLLFLSSLAEAGEYVHYVGGFTRPSGC
jgi:hypothetical protein